MSGKKKKRKQGGKDPPRDVWLVEFKEEEEVREDERELKEVKRDRKGGC